MQFIQYIISCLVSLLLTLCVCDSSILFSLQHNPYVNRPQFIHSADGCHILLLPFNAGTVFSSQGKARATVDERNTDLTHWGLTVLWKVVVPNCGAAPTLVHHCKSSVTDPKVPENPHVYLDVSIRAGAGLILVCVPCLCPLKTLLPYHPS